MRVILEEAVPSAPLRAPWCAWAVVPTEGCALVDRAEGPRPWHLPRRASLRWHRSARQLTPTRAGSSESTGVSCPHLPSRANLVDFGHEQTAWKGCLGAPPLGAEAACCLRRVKAGRTLSHCAAPDSGGDGPCVRSGRAWCGGSRRGLLAFATGPSSGSCFGRLSLGMGLVRDIQASFKCSLVKSLRAEEARTDQPGRPLPCC